MVCHFMPGILGEFLSDSEKQEVFLRNYGEIVYSEYKKNSLINVVQIPLQLPGQKQDEEKKQITSEGKLAKKRIIPIAEKTFTDVLDPHKFKFKFNKLENVLREEEKSDKKFEKIKIILPKATSQNSPERISKNQQDEEMAIEPTSVQVKRIIPTPSDEHKEMDIDNEQIDTSAAKGIFSVQNI